MIRQAVVLAGGRGERLRPLTDTVPKPMVPVNGVPFLDYLLWSLVREGISRVVILAGYKADMLVERYVGRTTRNLDIHCSIGTLSDQTARRIDRAYDLLDEEFLLVYGDNYWPLSLAAMEQTYRQRQVPLLVTVFANKNGTGEYGPQNNICVSAAGQVMCYDKKRKTVGLNGVDIGYFLVNRSIVPRGVCENMSFEEDVLVPLIAQDRVSAYLTDEQYYYLTDQKSVERFEAVVRQGAIGPLPGEYFTARTDREGRAR